MIFFNTKNRGYTLLFAVIVSSVVLAIAAFILQVSRKQFILASTARDSTVAIYAADSGIDCAVENQGYLQFASPAGSISCNGNTWSVSLTTGTGGTYGTTTFYLPVDTIVADGSPCARVDLGQWTDASGNLVTNIEARGYNVGWKAAAADCSYVSPRKQERALRLTYQ